MSRIKLIWDFRGHNAQKIAEHHAVHLREFAQAEGLENTLCETTQLTQMHTIAFLVVEESKMNELRERLKPHRGQRYQEPPPEER
ncbi:MAG: hypothetical protein AAF466_08210 [Bacteroidota bacterium]